MRLGTGRSRDGLRIALVVESMDTGVAQLIDTLACGLDQAGHEIHLLHSIDRADAKVMQRLRARPRIRCIPIDMKRRLQFRDASAGMRLRQYLKANGPFDIVHAHSSKAGALVRLFCLGLPAIRLYTPHAFYTLAPDLRFRSRLIYGRAERFLALFCTKVICSSALEKQHAKSLGIAEKRLAVITNAISPSQLAAPMRERFCPLGEAALIIGFVGRLEYQKALDVLLRAIAEAAQQGAQLRLVVIGSGSEENALVTMAAELGIANRITWLGRQPIYQYLASFDVLVMPSRYEGFSLIPLDAMHAGLPIVCTQVGGVAECVVDGETGIVVPVSDPIALASALVDLARSPDRLRSMGVESRARAALFTVERMVEETIGLYVEALSVDSFARPLANREYLPACDAKIVPERGH